MNVAGIDIGSTTTKVVIMKQANGKDSTRTILGRACIRTGFDHQATVEDTFSLALESANLTKGDIDYTVSTGYGRNNVPFSDRRISEISCHGQGALFFFPNARVVIDIGGQDSKAIKLSPDNEVVDFSMNEKCAAGTGRFIEVISKALQVRIQDMGDLAMKKEREVPISSMCTVFAESEIISKIAQGYRKEDIIHGLHNAVVNRVTPMVKGMGLESDVVLTGGVARNRGIRHAFEEKLQTPVHIPEEPHMTGAVGAAVIACKGGE